MKLILLIAGMFCFSIANAQLAPGGEFKTNYTKELKSFETQLRAGKQMEAERSFQMLMQMQQKHKKQLEGLLTTTADKEEKDEIANRIEDEGERLSRLKELAGNMAGNHRDLIEDLYGFLEE